MPPYFEAFVYTVHGEAQMDCTESSFQSIVFLDGEAVIIFAGGYDDMKVKKGESIFLPAGTGKYSVRGKCDFLLTYVV